MGGRVGCYIGFHKFEDIVGGRGIHEFGSDKLGKTVDSNQDIMFVPVVRAEGTTEIELNGIISVIGLTGCANGCAWFKKL